MNKKKKLDVHVVQHTHWDREWYFTSDDSRTMLYYDFKYLIDYLEKHDDKFTFDGQSSVLDDFLRYAPDWTGRLKKLIREKKILVGPFYTQTDNLLPPGESIIRNIEVGNYMAKKMGHSMQVGYLPDTFGHNNQSPQILQLNGINNISFYRGLDPAQTNDKLYFVYRGLDGSEVLGHWQTHYSTNSGAFAYTTKAFEEHIVSDYKKPGKFGPSVKSYAKRNLSLPIGIPMGTDQKPFRKEVKHILQELNQKYDDFNFIASDYETLLKNVIKEVNDKQIKLPIVTSELRQALTGRVHRSVLSSRMDIKQLLFKLETILIDSLEPLSALCFTNGVDVPWLMIENCWKELFKSSAHDSYGTTNEDVVNEKLKSRLKNAIRTAQGVVAMLSQIYAQAIIKDEDHYSKLIVFNFAQRPYSGWYKIKMAVKRDFATRKFRIFDGETEIKYAILDTDDEKNREQVYLTLLLQVEKIPAFSHKILTINHYDHVQYVLTKNNTICSENISIEINENDIIINNNGKIYKNLFQVAMDPSVGDTYDHSPITHNDKKYILGNYQVLQCSPSAKSIQFSAEAVVPSGIDQWKKNEVSVLQKVTIQLTIASKQIYAKLIVTNQADNARMILLVDTLSPTNSWKHDQQFGTYVRHLENKYMSTWEKPNEYGYKWDEYPTNLSPHQSFITNSESTFSVFTSGTREHEMINYENKNHFAITLYRAFGVFGTSGFLYRPGRGSGGKSVAPDCQLKNQKLEYDFVFNFSKMNEFDQFEFAKQLSDKCYFIPGQWGLDRVILAWKTDLDYYDNSKKRGAKLKLPSALIDHQFVMTALYMDVNKRLIARFLNLGNDITLKNDNQHWWSRNVIQFSQQDISAPRYGLINILLGERNDF